MLFSYPVLWYALAASVALGRSFEAARVTYEESELQAQEDRTSEVTATVAVNDGSRDADLKFVLAIRRSSMWTDVKRRTVTVSSDPRLNELLNADPDDLSDDDLALLRRACHDGLKCVAVDQLLVLRSATKTLPDGLVAVRRVIAKITHVVTRYTTEYYENTYEYEEVTEADDPTEVDETVTVIVEDNKELCGVEVGGEAAVVQNETHRTSVTRDSQTVVGGGTIGNLLDKDDDAATETTPVVAKTTPEIPSYKKDDEDDDLRVSLSARDHGAPGRRVTRGDHVATPRGDHVATPRGDHVATPRGDHVAAPRGDRVAAPRGDESDARIANTPSARVQPYDSAAASVSSDDDVVKNHGRRPRPSGDDTDSVVQTSVTLANDAEDNDGDNETKADVVSAGDDNVNTVKKGYVEDGIINNGDMKLYNINKGTINKGIINRSGADDGIINVGTLNNGPSNYGTVNSYVNDGTAGDDAKMRRFMSDVDQMYSTIMENFAKQ